MFTPSWLAVDGDLEVDEHLLSRLNKLELLFLSAAEDIKFVEELSNLDALILSEGENGHDVNFDKMSNLRSLTLIDWEISSLTALSTNKRLRNLYLVPGYVDDLDPIADLRRSHGLGVMVSDVDVSDYSVLCELPHVKWLSFPMDISQEDFSDIVAKFPRLEVIDLLGCHEISDLSPLYALKNLELITLYDELYGESQHEELKEALPDAQIVSGGVCMGSGWLLLVIPVITVATACSRLFKKRKL